MNQNPIIKGDSKVKVSDWKTIFLYDEGILKWKLKPSARPKLGDIAGKTDPSGYRKVGFKYKTYLVHRIIWEMHFGNIPKDKIIDHIDGNKLNNKIENLRLVTRSQNSRNRPSYRNGTSGIFKLKNKYRIIIQLDQCSTLEEAKQKRIKALEILKEAKCVLY